MLTLRQRINHNGPYTMLTRSYSTLTQKELAEINTPYIPTILETSSFTKEELINALSIKKQFQIADEAHTSALEEEEREVPDSVIAELNLIYEKYCKLPIPLQYCDIKDIVFSLELKTEDSLSPYSEKELFSALVIRKDTKYTQCQV